MMSTKEWNEEQVNFCDLIERKLAGFVKRNKVGKEGNLYNLLMPLFEKPLIALALKETGGNQSEAAQLLGIHRNTLRRKVKELQIESNGDGGRRAA